jgi:glucokinase
MKKVIGIDIGGTLIKSAVVDSNGKMGKVIIAKTESQKAGMAILEKIENIIGQLLTQNSDISGIGIGCPGPLDNQAGAILNPPNLPSLHYFPLKEKLAKKYHLPIKIDKDARCALIAETWLGSAKNLQNVILLTLGTGIGGAAVVDGKLLNGANGCAGEFGHMSINSKGPKCACGKTGCFEMFASARAMEELGQKEGLKFQYARQIVEQSYKNQTAKNIVKSHIDWLTVGIGNLINIFDPQVVILGGGLYDSQDLIYYKIEDKIQEFCLSETTNKIQILPAKFADFAGIIGAAQVFFV